MKAYSVSALERYHTFFGADLTLEYPTGSGRQLTLDQIAADLSDRLISVFARDANGRRPCFGGTDPLQSGPAWHDNLFFNEYFHGDNGAGLGASHQTGWTGLVADLIRRKYGAVPSVGAVIAEIAATRVTERGQTRADDRVSEAAMEDRKREGYF